MNLIDVIDDTLRNIKEDMYVDTEGNVHKLRNNSIIMSKTVDRVDTSYIKQLHIPEIEVKNMDSLDSAYELLLEGFRGVTVLNMASWHTPGGGVLKGSRAQEEDICRRTNLLYAIGEGSKVVSNILGINYSKGLYPINPLESIYCENVTVFRESNTYEYMDNPFNCNIITCAAIQNPVLVDGKLSEKDRELTKTKIKNIIFDSGGNALVLGAFGCGAYHNPPKEIAELFKKVIEEGVPFYIKKIVFAILDKKTTDGNLKPFQDVFNNK